ncbi:MAG: adenylate/guanylate cyclase domain-containing protein, partial [Bacteroidetes bacterium]
LSDFSVTFGEASLLNSDIVKFTEFSSAKPPAHVVEMLNAMFKKFDHHANILGLEKIKTIGDAYLLIGGINSEQAEDQAKKVVLAALEIQEFMAAIAVERRLHGQHFFEARIGIHTGPLVAGIVGIKKFAYDIWGDTVNIASRMETNSLAGRVNLSATSYELVKDHFTVIPHGRYTEHGVELEMYLVEQVVG